MKKIIIMTMLATGFFIACTKPATKTQVTKLFTEINRLGIEQKKGCASRFINNKIFKLASKKFAISMRSFTKYLETREGKTQMKDAISQCLRLIKK